MVERTFKPLTPGHVRPTGDLPGIRTRYGIKLTYYLLSGFFFILTLIAVPLYFNLDVRGIFSEEFSEYRSYLLFLIAVFSLFSLLLRLRASFCVICHKFRWPTQLDFNDYCRDCGAHLFKFQVYKNQEVGKSKYDLDLNERLLKMAKQGENDAIQTLLGKGAEIDYQDKFGHTALMGAAMDNRLTTIDFLMAWGANPTAKNNFGLNALMLAVDQGHTETAVKMLEFIDPRERTRDGRTALDIARRHGNTTIIRLLEKATPEEEPPEEEPRDE